MKIFIYRILDKQIYFFTDYGEGRGIWKEDTEPFHPGKFGCACLHIDNGYSAENSQYLRILNFQV